MSPTPDFLRSTLVLWAIAIFRSMGSSAAFLQYDASSLPTTSLPNGHLPHRRRVLPTHSSLSATERHCSFNELGIPSSSTTSTPRYEGSSLQSAIAFVPLENTVEYQQESLRSKPTHKSTIAAAGKSTFKSKLNTPYRPFFMNFGTATNAEATAASPPRHSQSKKTCSSHLTPSSSSPLSPKSQVSKTISIRNEDPVILPFGCRSRARNHHVDAENRPIASSAVSKEDVQQQPVNTINTNGSRQPIDPLREMKRQSVPSTAKASTGAKVVETLAKAYAHPMLPDLPVPAMPSPIIAPSSIHSEETTDGATKQDSIDWSCRLKALEEAVLSLTRQRNQNPEAQNKNLVVDANPSPATPPEQGIVPSSGNKDRDHQDRNWNLIEKMKQQLDALQDKVHDLEKYETKTIQWVIPKIDKHIRPTSASTFRSHPFFVGSTPFHLELQVQEPTGAEIDTEEQSVSFYLWHHHRRMQHHRYPQSHHHLRPFHDPEQNAAARHSSQTSDSLPIQLAGSKLTIGGCEYTFSDPAAIELGKQDGWGWRRLMSLKELRQQKCICNDGQFDVQFQVRVRRLNHRSSRIGVAMIS